MQGPTENALMLVAAGNAFMAGRDISGFWPNAPTFQFLKLCEFRLPPASGNDADEYPLVASDPMEFFALQKQNCRGYRLHHTVRKRGPSQQIDAPDRMLTAFVGGGAQWLIEAVGEFNSELWEGFHRLGDRDDPDRRIWLCTHIMQGMMPVKESEPVGLDEALSDLRVTLPDIEAYAREEKWDNFADCFARAREALDGKAKDKSPWTSDIIRYTGFSQHQLNVLQAINHAWVFGGMGSWNDTGGGERYDEVSERLYSALNDCIAGLANSTYRG
jgi:hypothetical protein